MLENGNIEEFINTYGDYYIQGTHRGASITIMMKLKESN